MQQYEYLLCLWHLQRWECRQEKNHTFFPQVFVQNSVWFTVGHLFLSRAFHSKVAITKCYFCITSTLTTSNWHHGGPSAAVLPICYSLHSVMEKHTHAQTTTICLVLLEPSCFNWCCIHTRTEMINWLIHPQKISQVFLIIYWLCVFQCVFSKNTEYSIVPASHLGRFSPRLWHDSELTVFGHVLIFHRSDQIIDLSRIHVEE